MNSRERIIMATILLAISAMTIVDLITDRNEGIAWWHLSVEGSVAIISLVGVFFLMKGTFKLKKTLKHEREVSIKFQEESKLWKEHSIKYLQGLSQSIDNQLGKWLLTKSEKEVAFLLLKGFSLKEIAEIRNTTEKTARAQATSIYSKAELSGRSQLSAFFLEDLLLPDSPR
ncbi:MAG: response regulator transcription factor [Bacteriovoracaceae bacterium]|jgi:DNA-binding CsgD family transcriptional regulator|nr:response regulator transcription factor [Bacteriovoracaceae bacterium]